MSLVGRNTTSAMIQISRNRTKCLVAVATTLGLVVRRNPSLSVQARIMHKGIRLCAGAVVAARALVSNPSIGIHNLVGHRRLSIFNSSNVVELIINNTIVMIGVRNLSSLIMVAVLVARLRVPTYRSNCSKLVVVHSRLVMQKGRLLNKALITLSASVSKLTGMTLHVVVHCVLARKSLAAVLVLAHKVASSVLDVIESHLVTLVTI